LPGPDLQLLIDAARAAGPTALKHWKADPQVWDKPGQQGPVSEADLEVDAQLKAHLTRARPTYGWLSEESEPDPQRFDRTAVFVVDPIDGTRAFLDGRDGFAHSLAIVRNGVPTEAVVYLPAFDRIYAAELGGGATRDGQSIAASGRDALEGGRLLGQKSNFRPENWGGEALPATQHFRSSLAWRLCLVADGTFDGMITLRDCWEWDVAAGALIVAEAAGAATDRDGDTLRFNSAAIQTPGLIAAPPGVHDDLMARRRSAG
jgi:myo-inositol-1(or 4)-monophosphatase